MVSIGIQETCHKIFSAYELLRKKKIYIYLHIVLKVTEVCNKTLQALSLDMPDNIGVGKGADPPILKLEGLSPPPKLYARWMQHRS